MNLEPIDAYKWQESANDEFFEGLFVTFQRSVDNDIANSINAFVALYKEVGTRMKRTYPKIIHQGLVILVSSLTGGIRTVAMRNMKEIANYDAFVSQTLNRI